MRGAYWPPPPHTIVIPNEVRDLSADSQRVPHPSPLRVRAVLAACLIRVRALLGARLKYDCHSKNPTFARSAKAGHPPISLSLTAPSENHVHIDSKRDSEDQRIGSLLLRKSVPKKSAIFGSQFHHGAVGGLSVSIGDRELDGDIGNRPVRGLVSSRSRLSCQLRYEFLLSPRHRVGIFQSVSEIGAHLSQQGSLQTIGSMRKTLSLRCRGHETKKYKQQSQADLLHLVLQNYSRRNGKRVFRGINSTLVASPGCRCRASHGLAGGATLSSR